LRLFSIKQPYTNSQKGVLGALLRGGRPPGYFLENFPEKPFLPPRREPEKFLPPLKRRLEDLPLLVLEFSKDLTEPLGPFWTFCRGSVRTLAPARLLKVCLCRVVSEETVPGAGRWREVLFLFLPRAVNDLAEFFSPFRMFCRGNVPTLALVLPVKDRFCLAILVLLHPLKPLGDFHRWPFLFTSRLWDTSRL
jgi:hypothetical protein